MGKLFWIIRVGPKHSHYVSLQNGGRKRFDRDKMKRQCDHGGKDWSFAGTSQAMPAATRGWQKQRMKPPSRDTLILSQGY